MLFEGYDIDTCKLSRDYLAYPLQQVYYIDILGKKHKGLEQILKADLEYLYLEINMTIGDLAKYFNIKRSRVQSILAKNKIVKPMNLVHACTERTCLKKYGVKNINSSPELKKKALQTNKERYGGNAPACSEYIRSKMYKTNKEKYGKEFALQCDSFKEKAKNTTKERYGVDNASKSEIIKEKKAKTTLKHYGVENPFQAEICKEKLKQTCIERYGVQYPNQNEEIKQKGWQKKKENGTTNTSKPENQIYKLLKIKFNIVERQYKSEEYPFACDFYIPSLNLYIEYQGTIEHGKEPYDPNNLEHQAIIKEWLRRAELREAKIGKESRYRGFIDTWTVRDPKKREISRKNNLNWIEFFTLNQFIQWYNNIKGESNE